MSKFSDLSSDELGNIAEFSSRKGFKKLESLVKNFNNIDCLRCKSTEKIFEDQAGVSLKYLINKLRDQEKLIESTIDYNINRYIKKTGSTIKIDDEISEYFINIYLYTFDNVTLRAGINAYFDTLISYIKNERGLRSPIIIKYHDLINMLKSDDYRRNIHTLIIKSLQIYSFSAHLPPVDTGLMDNFYSIDYREY